MNYYCNRLVALSVHGAKRTDILTLFLTVLFFSALDATSTPSLVPNSAPSFNPTPLPITCRPTIIPTTRLPTQPSMIPSTKPTYAPSALPSKPTAAPTGRPTMVPSTLRPTATPSSIKPSATPTCRPSMTPTTFRPSAIPTTASPSQPTFLPSGRPTAPPTTRPSATPSSIRPSAIPTTVRPSSHPTISPSATPSSIRPSVNPSVKPSAPTAIPSASPTSPPTYSPSSRPTTGPTGDAICPAGTFIVRFSTYYQCTSCAPGYFSAANATSCDPCPLNSYAESAGSAFCQSCPAGNVNGGLASARKNDCVNPTINFVLGLLSLFFGAVMIFFYIFYGRLQQIAFERRVWLVDKSALLFGIVFQMIEETQRICHAISTVLAQLAKDREERILREGNWCSFEYLTVKAKRLLLPLLFFLLSALVALAVIAGTVLSAVIHVLFNAVLLFRGYKIYLSLKFSFLDRITEFLDELGFALNISFIVDKLSYPLIYFLNLLSSISIDLASVKVNCSGSQVMFKLQCLNTNR